MNNSLSKQQLRSIAVIISTTLAVMIGFGQACQNFESNSSSGSSVLPSFQSPATRIEVIPNTKTVSVVYSRQIVDNMTSCTGIKKPAPNVLQEFESRKGTLSEYGYALQVTAPMLMGIVAIAGEVCEQLVLQESASGAQKRIFQGVDFSTVASQVNDSDISLVVRRLARSCWSRNETEDERQLIISSYRGGFVSEGTTHNAMLYLCTGMLSSLSALEM